MDKILNFLSMESKNPFLRLIALVVGMILLFTVLYLVAWVFNWLGFEWPATPEGEPIGV